MTGNVTRDADTWSLAGLVELAVSVAHEAGALARERRGAVEQMAVASTKSTPTDIVTESDTAAERLIRERVLQARPGDAIHGEEGGHSDGESGVVWVVDPIDGTVNYLYGFPHYAVSIGIQVEGTVEGGVVHNPATGETWAAIRGSGAMLDDEPIRTSQCTDLSLALVGTGFSYDSQQRAQQAEIVAGLLPQVRDIRRAGVASLDLCAVACGRLDAFYESGLKLWDSAAGALIAEEAGGVVTGLHGAAASQSMVVAAAPGIVHELTSVIEHLTTSRSFRSSR
ncbi:inositol monophosphatase [Actinobacteria bacterium YIM 96077]|uniref:Inositol-1-monophosphatase n=1 Tax=Phytoactinopolyspora halophila TaxID=1981511 RepID=A0A329QP92_9ACTN|nr:inositol monophosphatase family protein [Phytoactinopolyspora halophila]AYY13497.1 inositol monophosphatase [Actinobacteria bacterium YIM 96077]RAW12448.1 inositol monophosphatase [Phytoactinopolyspora halophila]